MGSQVRGMRQIEVGKLVLSGMSFGAALRKVGYSKSLSRNPKNHGWDAEVCVRLALEADPDVSPVDLRLSARKLFQETLDNADPKKTSLTGAARAAEIAEKIGVREGDTPPVAARTAGERMAFLAEMFEAYREAGGDIAALGKGLRPAVRSLGSTAQDADAIEVTHTAVPE